MSELSENPRFYDPIGPLVPDEEEVVHRANEELAPIFELSSSLFDFSTNLFDQGPEIPRTLLPDTIHLGLGMYSQVLKCYRSVIANVKIGLSEPASAVCRILFETSTASSFIFRQSVYLKHFEKGQLVEVNAGDQLLTVDFRAQLYELHERYENRRWIEDIDRLGATEDLAIDLRSEVGDPNFTEELERRIGTEWVKRIKTHRHYSGMNLKSVAVSLGDAYWSYYLLRYRPLSWNVHAGNANWSVRSKIGEDNSTATISVSWYSDPSELWLPILDATVLTFLALKVFVRRFANSARNTRDLYALYEEFIALDRPQLSKKSQ